MPEIRPVEIKHERNADGTDGCKADLTPFCSFFYIPVQVMQPDPLHPGQMQMKMGTQRIVVQPLRCPNCQKPLTWDLASPVAVAKGLPAS